MGQFAIGVSELLAVGDEFDSGADLVRCVVDAGEQIFSLGSNIGDCRGCVGIKLLLKREIVLLDTWNGVIDRIRDDRDVGRSRFIDRDRRRRQSSRRQRIIVPGVRTDAGTCHCWFERQNRCTCC